MSDERTISYVAAFTEAVRLEMAADPTVFIAGEDVGAHGGVFHTFDGVQAEFGERRAVDTPISEQAIIGLGIGAAVTGLRPIVDLMFMDFMLVAADQIANQAAKLKYMFGGDATLPLTITTTGGRRAVRRGAAQPEPRGAVLPHPRHQGRLPVERVRREGPDGGVDPRGQPDAVRAPQADARQKGVVPEERYEIPLGVANVLARGRRRHRRLVGQDGQRCRTAADELAADGISCEVIDLRTLPPLDIDTVRRTRCARPTGWSSPTRRCASAASAPRSRRRSRSTPSTTSTRRSVGSPRRTRRSRSARARRPVRARPGAHRRRHPRGLGAAAAERLIRARGHRRDRRQPVGGQGCASAARTRRAHARHGQGRHRPARRIRRARDRGATASWSSPRHRPDRRTGGRRSRRVPSCSTVPAPVRRSTRGRAAAQFAELGCSVVVVARWRRHVPRRRHRLARRAADRHVDRHQQRVPGDGRRHVGRHRRRAVAVRRDRGEVGRPPGEGARRDDRATPTGRRDATSRSSTWRSSTPRTPAPAPS